MKKTIAFIFALAMLGSAMSCSQNNNNSESSSGSASGASLVNESANGTAFKRGSVKDNVYENKYANIKINIPEGLKAETDESIESMRASTVSYYTDEKESAFEHAAIWDAWFSSSTENVLVRFVNTKLAFPGETGKTADDVLDVYKNRNAEGNVEYKERKSVTLCGEEYRRDVFTYDGFKSNCLYARKIDDDIICFINVSSEVDGKTPEDYEAMFAD